MRLRMLLAGALVAGLLGTPAPAHAGHEPDHPDRPPDCDVWNCGTEIDAPDSGDSGGSGGGWAMWTSRIYSILETTDRHGNACLMAYPDGGDLTGPEVLDQIGAAWEDYREAQEQYEEDRAAYRRADRAAERARDARDDAGADLEDARRARDEARQAVEDNPDDEAARLGWEAADAAVTAAEESFAEAEERLSAALAALAALTEPVEPAEPLPACGSARAEASAEPPVPEPRIEPGAALTGITSYLEIDFDDEVTDDGTFETTFELFERQFVLEATPQVTVDWGDGAEPEDVGNRRGEPYPGGPQEITHTYADAELVDVVVRVGWVATLREVGRSGWSLDLDTLTTTGTLEDFPIQQAQAVRVR